MKKTLIALAAVAVAGAASAQVTLSGNVQFSAQKVGKGDLSLDQGNAAIKFAANEDLGGGMKASAHVQMGMDDHRGSGAIQKDSSLSLSGGFGNVNMYTALSGAYKSGQGASLETDSSDYMGGYVGVSGIIYTLPTFVEGVTVQAEYSSVYTLADDNATNWTGVGRPALKGSPYLYVGYSTGPLWVRIQGAGDDFGNTWDLRASYDFGVAKIKVRTAKDKDQEFSIAAPVGAVMAGLEYGKTDGGAKSTAVFANYSLSKRTALTMAAANGTDTTGAASNNYRIGVSHSF